MIHIDLGQCCPTQIGDTMVPHRLQEALAELHATIEVKCDIDEDRRNLHEYNKAKLKVYDRIHSMLVERTTEIKRSIEAESGAK